MLTLQPATFEEFARETARGNVVPVVRTVLADLQTPVSAHVRVGCDASYSFLLESVEGGERVARYSFLGAQPEMVVRGRGRDTFIERGDTCERLVGTNVVEFLRAHFRARKLGTRPRGAGEAEDAALGAELRADEKERAEHMMLVDLGRNDLGRVAAYGSVKVNELMTVERYSHVQHLVTSLRARLRDDRDRFDALAACFPAGTVSGAPKVRAMQIIGSLEPDARGVYAGAVLYADYADNLDSCIAIRTVVLRDSHAHVQAGAGIVADSVPEREDEETVSKARALLNAVEMAEKGL